MQRKVRSQDRTFSLLGARCLVIQIRHIVDVMENIAPSSLAEPWDNVGLQAGHEGWPVEKIWVALDPTLRFIEEASRNGANLVITHHPLLYRPLSAIDPETLVGRIMEVVFRKRVGVFCAHTNLDSARGGLNDMLAKSLGINNTIVLKANQSDQYKLVTYVPQEHENMVVDALFASGAGNGEKYSHISFRTQGIGTFMPCLEAKPLVGRPGEINRVSECRIEIPVAGRHLPQVTKALLDVHPYEEVVYDVYCVGTGSSGEGLGRIGDLEDDLTLDSFARLIKQTLGLETVRMVGDPHQKIKRVALCSGSGKSLLEDFLASDAQVFVTGDLGYHDGRCVEGLGRAIVDIGHFASEHLVVEGLVGRLRSALSDKGYDVRVEPYTQESDCFRFV